MTRVYTSNYIRYSGYDGETVNMIESFGEDENDYINLKGMKEPTTIIAGNGKDKIYGSTKHINMIFGDNAWGFGQINPTEDEYNAYSGKDTIYGGDDADFIHGGRGNDKMYGKKGINIFQFKKGDGKDTIVMGKGTDYLYFCDSSVSELSYTQKNKDLIVKYSETDQVTIKDYFKTFGHVSLKGIADQSFNIETIAKGVNSILYDNNGNEKWSTEWQLTKLENKVEDYLEKALKNLPTPKSLYQAKGMTIIRTKGGTSKGTDAADIITGSNGKDKLYGNGGNDSITGGKGNDYIVGGKGKDTINGGSGNDTIYATSGNDIITGSNGNDKIYAGSGADTFVYAKNSGKDTIYKANSSDKIKYKDVESMKDLKFAKKKNNLIITRKNGIKKETITLSDFFKSTNKLDKIVLSDGTAGSILASAQLSISGSGTIDGSEYNETIKGSFRADVIYGRGGNDKITGHKGADTINAGKGTNYIYFGKNDGNDVVISGGGKDTLVFKKQALSDIYAKYSGNNLIIYYKGGTVVLKNYKAGGHSAQYLKTTSGTVAIDDIIKVKQTTTDGYTKYYGAEVKDNILVRDLETMEVYGNGGGDIIRVTGNADEVDVYGGKGDDKITLDFGGNTLHFQKGDGKDTVTEKIEGLGNDSNTFIFENETNAANLKFTKTTNGYKIGYNNNADSVTVIQNGTPDEPYDDFFGLGNLEDADIVKIKGGEEFIVSNKGILKIHTGDGNGTSASDYFESTAGTISGRDGNDYINVSSSSTTKIYGGEGNDEILIADDHSIKSLYFDDDAGNDIVYDQYTGGRSNKLQYVLTKTNETDFDKISVTREGNDVKITYNGGQNSILIKSLDDTAPDDFDERNYGDIVIEGVSKSIASYFETDSANGAKMSTSSMNQIKEVTAGFMSTKSSDVPPQLYDDNKENVYDILAAGIDTNNVTGIAV